MRYRSHDITVPTIVSDVILNMHKPTPERLVKSLKLKTASQSLGYSRQDPFLEKNTRFCFRAITDSDDLFHSS